MRQKVTVIGAGNVGATVAQRVFDRGYADVVLVDIVEGLPQGKALDILESGPVTGSDSSIIGTNDYAATAGSDVVVVTSGIARKPGMSRDDLLFTNMDIVGSVIGDVVKHSPDGIIITVTNPLDAMTQHALEVSGLPRTRVFGMAGILDTARFRSFLAEEINVAVEDVHAYVLGGHGDTMVPLVRYCTVAGIPVTKLISKERIDSIVERTKGAGGEVVGLLKTGSAFVSPALSAIEMAESILRDKKRVLACACLLEGEYGVDGLYVGVPCVLGAGGVERVIEIDLEAEEKKAFDASVEHVRTLVDQIQL